MNSVGKTNIGKTYYDYYEFFVNYLKKGAKSKGTQEIYARKVKEFFMFTTGSENIKGLKDHPFANPTVEQFVEYSKYDETISGSTNARTGLNCFIDMLNEYGEKCDRIKYTVQSYKKEKQAEYMKKDFIEEVAWSCEEKKGTAAVLLCFEWLLDKKSLSVIRKVDYDYRTYTLEVYRDKERRVLKTVAKLTERTAKALELAFEEMEMLVHEINQGKDVRKIRNSDYLFQSRKTGDGYSEAEENVIGKGAVEGAFYNVAKCYFKKSNGKYELKELEKMIKLRNIKESGKCYLCAKYKDINYILSLVNETRKQTFVRAQAYSPRLYPELYE